MTPTGIIWQRRIPLASGLQNAAVYLDGVPQTTSGGNGMLATQWTTYFSVEHNPAYSVNDMTGLVDEFRVSNSRAPPPGF